MGNTKTKLYCKAHSSTGLQCTFLLYTISTNELNIEQQALYCSSKVFLCRPTSIQRGSENCFHFLVCISALSIGPGAIENYGGNMSTASIFYFLRLSHSLRNK